MARSFKLPDLGEGIHEAEVLAVPVKEGQEVREGDIILEVETDKAAVEIPSPYSGTVEKILVKIGDIVHVGDAMMVFSGGEDAAAGRTGPGSGLDRSRNRTSRPVSCPWRGR